MSNSNRTTNFGPRVSFTTTKSDPGPVHVYGDSNSTFEWDGPANFDGTATFSDVDPIKFSNITTASPVSTFIADGHFSIVSHSANSMVIAIRSGATTYRWTNDAGSVL